jgi:AcrR family transcriptional regulator
MTEQDRDRREEILEAAIRVFAEHGFHKATIKQIAKEADLKSPALIYWYFDNKHALLKGVINQLSPLVEVLDGASALMDIPPDKVLRMMAQNFFATFEHPTAGDMFRILLSEAIHNIKLVEDFVETAPKHLLRFLTSYLNHQITLGYLRPHDVESSARMFIGSLLVTVLMREIMTPLAVGLPQDNNDYVDTVVTIFLDGLSTQK